MKFRVARHTTDLKKITSFYKDVLGLEVLGEFTGHKGYDGVFIGLRNENWHLEFTISDEKPNHKPDEDDLLVFYADDREKFNSLVEKVNEAGVKPVQAKNPYWEENGATFLDPDGYRIVIAINTQQ